MKAEIRLLLNIIYTEVVGYEGRDLFIFLGNTAITKCLQNSIKASLNINLTPTVRFVLPVLIALS